jgi:hypothetical protein
VKAIPCWHEESGSDGRMIITLGLRSQHFSPGTHMSSHDDFKSQATVRRPGAKCAGVLWLLTLSPMRRGDPRFQSRFVPSDDRRSRPYRARVRIGRTPRSSLPAVPPDRLTPVASSLEVPASNTPKEARDRETSATFTQPNRRVGARSQEAAGREPGGSGFSSPADRCGPPNT